VAPGRHASVPREALAESQVLVPFATRPNDKRSHAGPRALDWNCNALPALADATGSTIRGDAIPSCVDQRLSPITLQPKLAAFRNVLRRDRTR